MLFHKRLKDQALKVHKEIKDAGISDHDEKVLLGVFNEIIASSCDFDICFEVGADHSLSIKNTDSDRVRIEVSPSYEETIENYARTRVCPSDVEIYREKAKLSNVIDNIRKYGFYDIYVSEMGPDGVVLKKCLKHTFLGNSEKLINVIKQDVTEAVAREEEAATRLEQALVEKDEAMKAQTYFLTRISHEIRTPMNAILGLTSTLEEDMNDREALEKSIRQIRYSGEFLLNIVNDVLDVSRIAQDKFTVRKDKAVLSDLYEAVDMMIVPMCQQKDITYSFYNDVPEDTFVRTDIMRLTQLFVNLLSNAVKYTPEGGSINFDTRRIKETSEILVCEFRVIDNGIGMSPEFMKRMFEPFSQEARTAGSEFIGTGLGLAIVKGIVDALGGTINVHSVQGRGSDFTVTLEFEKLEVDRSAKFLPVETDLSGRRILVVEDNEINRDIAANLLNKKHAYTDTAENGAIAVDKFQASDIGFFDVILMDIRMPVMNGTDAANMIRSLDRPDAKTVRIVAMTADIIDTEGDSPFDAALTKPVNPKVLYAALMQ